MLLTEHRIETLINLAVEYATASNLVPEAYVSGLINPDAIGNADAGQVVETLIKYHKEWLRKSIT